MESQARVLPSADVDNSALLRASTTVWHLAQVRNGADVGEECVIGRGAFVDAGVVVGRACKIQNYALIYAPARLEEGVFVGPAAVLTNDVYPRAIEPDGTPKRAGDWEARGVSVSGGASIGASATVLAGVTIGAWATVAAGAVVTSSVPAYALMVGAPARRIGWVGPAGVPLQREGDTWRCPVEGRCFVEYGERIEEHA
jgi:acetyltransferase-like isoleucine patch superfamily enzyme